MNWISIEDQKPKARQRVYVTCLNAKKRYQTMAEYVPYMEVPEEDFMADDYWGDGDYSEEKDEFFTPEGFYEYQFEAEEHYKIHNKVTHWMPLLELPKLELITEATASH